MKQLAFLVAGVLIGFILAGAVFVMTRVPAGNPIVLEPPPTKVPIEVQVLGGVVRPGVYALPDGSRVQDAVDAAGGLLAETDIGTINMAAKLQDGQQVQIPGGAAPTKAGFTVIGTPTSQPTATPRANADLININTAGVGELESLNGIGPTLAQKIIQYRQLQGCFQTIDELQNVQGMGLSLIDQLRSLITVNPIPASCH